ncbi:hypothetical protein ACNKHQ_21010 [Shigella flexneri]
MMAHLGFVHTTIKRFDEDLACQAWITRLPDDHTELSREKSMIIPPRVMIALPPTRTATVRLTY